MSETKNVIAKDCKVYSDLLNAYKNNLSNPVERFFKCYDIIDKASYHEIHFIITLLKEFKGANFFSNTDLPLIKEFLDFINRNGTSRRAFILDLLEEARERKRPSN